MTTTQPSTTEQTRAVVTQFYDAVRTGDYGAALGLLADDVVVHEPSFLPYGGTYRGLEQFQALMGDAMKHLDVGRTVVARLLADGDRGFGILHIPATASGEQTVIAEESVVRDGKIVEVTVYFHETQQLHRA